MTRIVSFIALMGIFLVCGFEARSLAVAPDAKALLRADAFDELQSYFGGAQARFEKGELAGDLLRNEFRAFYPTDADLRPHYDAWIKRFPTSYVARLARAIYYKKVGMDVRGSKYIADTPRSQIDAMDAAYEHAIADFGASMELTAKPFLSYLHMLDINGNYSDSDRGRQLLDHALELDPTTLAAREKYMQYLETRWGGSLEQMEAFLEESRHSKLSPENFESLKVMVTSERGWLAEQRGDHAAAELAYKSAAEVPGENCSCAQMGLIGALLHQQKYAEALPHLDQLLAANDHDDWARYNRAFAYYRLGNLNAAVQDWRKAAEDGDADAEEQMGLLYLGNIPGVIHQDLDASIDWLRKAAAQGKQSAEANLRTAIATRDLRSKP